MGLERKPAVSSTRTPWQGWPAATVGGGRWQAMCRQACEPHRGASIEFAQYRKYVPATTCRGSIGALRRKRSHYIKSRNRYDSPSVFGRRHQRSWLPVRRALPIRICQNESPRSRYLAFNKATRSVGEHSESVVTRFRREPGASSADL